MADDLPKGKLLGKLRQIWSKLSDGENYLIPESIEEIKVLGPFPFFQIKQTPIYAKDVDSTQRAFYDFAGELRSFMGENRYSSATLIEATRNQIRENFSCEEQKPFEWHLCQVISLAQAQNKLRLFVMALDGLDLIDFHEIQAGSWRLVDFTKDEAKMHLDKISGDHQWKEHISQLFANEFIGRKCILVAAQGDREQARLNADRTARFVINTLRYAICIHLAHVSRAHECGIDSPSGTDSWSFKYFQYDLDSGEACFGRGAGQRQNYKLNVSNLRKLKAEWDFDALWSLIAKDQLTDVEAGIVNAVNWLGDAQQEEDEHISFVKYWVSLEALITGYKGGNETKRLKTAIPILLSQGSASVPSKKEVERMYKVRSNLLHGRKASRVRRSDLNKLCGWACFCIVCYLSLRERGYTTRQQIHEQAERIDRAKRRGAKM